MQTTNNIKKLHFPCVREMIIVLLLAVPVLTSRAQVFDNSRKVDTLTFAERFSVRTNMVDWVLTVPNIGFEFDLGSKNWNRYAVNVNLRYRPHTSSTFVRPFEFEMFEATIEGRQYWHERRAEPSGYLKRHTKWYDKIFSCRRMVPKHPKWIFYRGAYLSFVNYAILLDTRGRQGNAVMAGFTWGFVKPFIAFQNGNSIDMEFGISGGLAYNKFDRFTYNEEKNIYPKLDEGKWHIEKYPVIRDVHAALVYRFGNYPIQKKYRWRYDVDMDYRNRRDSIFNGGLARREHTYIKDSIYAVVARDFKVLYDSCVDARHRMSQEEIDERAPRRREDMNFNPKNGKSNQIDPAKKYITVRRNAMNNSGGRSTAKGSSEKVSVRPKKQSSGIWSVFRKKSK